MPPPGVSAAHSLRKLAAAPPRRSCGPCGSRFPTLPGQSPATAPVLSGDNTGNSRARGEPRASSPQRPTCSRRIPYIPAAVPAQWLRLMVFRQARYCRHFTCRRRLPLAARLTFLSRETVWAVFCRSVVADNTLTIKQKSTLPVSKTRQDKSLFRSLSDAYLPPAAQSRSHQPPIAQLSVAPALLPPPRAAPALR